MKASTKVKLVNVSTWVMLVTISFVALFFVGFVVSTTFDLNVFAERTSTFIFSFIGFSAVLIFCSAILNVSLNIGLIADSRLHEIKDPGQGFSLKRFGIAAFLLVTLLVAFMFGGNYLSRMNEKNKLVGAAESVTRQYATSIDKIPAMLTDTTQFKELEPLIEFLAGQRQEFTWVEVITEGRYDGQLTYFQFDKYSNASVLKPGFTSNFYKCDEHDCDYLEKFFKGETTDIHFWMEDSHYKVYMPFTKGSKKFILLFTEQQRYGKVGS